MKKQERANVVLGNLNKFYPKIPIPLKHQNIYELLIAVLLSAQCTDERVNRITPLLFKMANNPHDMAKVPVNKIYKIIKPCGLAPKKSKAISKLSKILIKKLFPEATWNRLHLQMIFYGREYCKARSCFGIECKICTDCYPKRTKAIKVKKP